jgi:hypothetical protein
LIACKVVTVMQLSADFMFLIYLPWVVAEQEIPWQGQEGLTTQGGHSACRVEGTAQPIQVSTRRSGFGDGPGSAACRDVACKASIAVGESRLGSLRRQLMDL